MKGRIAVNSIETHRFGNGLQLLVEPKKNVKSCGLHWVFPSGACMDDGNRVGASVMLAEMLVRGAGSMDSRALSDAMDRCGMRRSTDVGVFHLSASATMLGTSLDRGLELLSTMVLEPHLAEESVEPVRSLCLQSLDSLRDEPQHEVMLRLRARHRRSPFNRNGYGERDAIESMARSDLQSAWERGIVPDGAMLGVCGDVEPSDLVDRLEERFGTWSGTASHPKEENESRGGAEHVDRDSAQVHIALAWDAPAASHADAVLERLASRIFGGSSSGRLFTEVRQKQSLCYSVGGSYRVGPERGEIVVYAGTTPERAQKTLDTCLAEYRRMKQGITEDEFNRARIGLESGLIFSGESTSARATALVSDQFLLGHPRSLDDVRSEIAAVTLDQVNAYLARRSDVAPTIVTMGPAPLDIDDS
ncbi:MAG: pitrilysin family protein [Planctomycetota bacterium]|nr:pitrilysin family protein [Planctomycetota bacterium]